MNVTLLRADGTDLDVVNAAHASFDRMVEAERWEEMPGGWRRPVLKERSQRLVLGLGGHDPVHFSPFTHVGLSLHVKAPIFVARQLWKSHVGVTGGDAGTPGWNEVSRRYVDEAIEVWQPDVWRKKPEKRRQGSLDEPIGMPSIADLVYGAATDKALEAYGALLNIGVAPEQARAVLPGGVVTKWVWTGSLYFFARIVGLRLGETAQKETGEVAAQIAAIAAERFPVSWAALLGEPS